MTALARAFSYEGRDLRADVVDGEPWFVASDVATLLGYRMASDLTRRLDEDERGTRSVRTPGGDQDMAVISEAGLYSAILASKLPAAKAFKRWVTHEVLPAIRATGAYATTPAVDVSSLDRRALALMVVESENERIAAEAKVAELEPRAAVADRLMSAEGDYSVREAAQILARDPVIDMGERRLFAALRSHGWIQDAQHAYQRHVDLGRVSVRTQTHYDRWTGEPHLQRQIRITPKGLVALHGLLGGTGPVVTDAEPPQLALVGGAS